MANSIQFSLSFTTPQDVLTESSDKSSAPADGSSAITVTITVTDPVTHDPLPGKQIQLSETTGQARINGQPPAIAATETSDTNGVVKFTVTDLTAETATFEATEL